MCVPLAAAGLALGAASAGASAIGGRQQAKAQYQAQLQQNEMQRRMQAQAAAAERTRASRQMTGERLQQAQQEEAIGRQTRERELATQAAVGLEQARDRGVAGQSVTAVMGEYLTNLGAAREALGRQQELIGVGKGLALEDIGLASQQRLISIDQPIAEPIKPRGLGLQDLLSVASGGFQGYALGSSLSNLTAPTTTGMQAYTSTPTTLGRSNLKITGGYYTGFNPRG
jgi:hypothetical protein